MARESQVSDIMTSLQDHPTVRQRPSLCALQAGVVPPMPMALANKMLRSVYKLGMHLVGLLLSGFAKPLIRYWFFIGCTQTDPITLI
jgi:hypothetical protein